MGTSFIVAILDAGSGRDAPRFRDCMMDRHWLSQIGRACAMQAELTALGLGCLGRGLDDALIKDRKAGFDCHSFCLIGPEGPVR